MRPTAVVSDIHSNLEALQAVLADVETHAVERIICLGDIVGYGPDPLACLDLAIKHFEFSLLGNHDYAIVHGATPEYSELARLSLEWTRSQLEGFWKRKYRNYLAGLATQKQEADVLFVHGSPRDPTFEYVHNKKIASASIGSLPQEVDKCFMGHTHRPALFRAGKEPVPLKPGKNRKFAKGRQLICVGSVGQPRDKDNRASWLLVTEQGYSLQRVSYPFHVTARKIREIPELDAYLADRLTHGS